MNHDIMIDSPGGYLKLSGAGSQRYLEVSTGSNAFFYRNIGLKYGDIAMNALGMYSLASIGREGQAVFTSLTAPNYLLRKRGAGCAWDPVIGIKSNIESIDLCPWKSDMEMCADALWDSCFEKLLGTGVDVQNLLATPEGRAIVQEMMRQIYLGLGNSYFMLAHFGNHELIEESDTNGWWQTKSTVEDWINFKGNQEVCTGLYTLVDGLKREGHENYNVEIKKSDVSVDKYIGDARALIDLTIDSAPQEFNLINDANIAQGIFPVIRATKGIFDRLKQQNMIQCFCENPEMFKAYMTGVSAEFNITPTTMMYRGYVIVRDDTQAIFDNMVGVITHRVLLGANGVFGIAYDTAQLAQFNGLGLRMVQHLDAPFQGKIYLSTAGKIGTAILDKSLVVNASLILTPQA